MVKAVAGSTTKEHKKGKPSKSGEKQIVINVFNKSPEKYPLLAIEKIAELTSEATGVSESRVFAARKERQHG
jgi:hypothetical protein